MRTFEIHKTRHFVTIPFFDGLISDLSNNEYPTLVQGWGHEGQSLKLPAGATHFVFVLSGPAKISRYNQIEESSFHLSQGMYASLAEGSEISGGRGIVISRMRQDGMFQIGGPIEVHGRLRYIDGCTDSLLIPPVIKGDACFNHLHFPKNISQTQHTHPSVRVGVVARGFGHCIVPNDDVPGADIRIPLTQGQVFIIPAGGEHSFFTTENTMDVIAYHPDSDFGPQHDDHPMVNRTMVNGVKAACIGEIRTTKIEA